MEIKTFSDLHEHILNFKSQEEADDFWYKKKWVAVDDVINLVNGGFGLNANALRKYIKEELK